MLLEFRFWIRNVDGRSCGAGAVGCHRPNDRSYFDYSIDRSIDPSIDFDPIAFRVRCAVLATSSSDLVHLILYFFVWSVYIYMIVGSFSSCPIASSLALVSRITQ